MFLLALLKDKKLSIEADLTVDFNQLPKPNCKSTKECVESEDLTLTPDSDKDIDELCLRQSYVNCANAYKHNEEGNVSRQKDHDKSCLKHHTDA